ncbi:hypothetical protein F4859DRAFT_183047 [Xylaria cf. heliscus]|nr:hypothetical protein F4859DRAFT_183047 [Xylaria cf. heliscus]
MGVYFFVRLPIPSPVPFICSVSSRPASMRVLFLTLFNIQLRQLLWLLFLLSLACFVVVSFVRSLYILTPRVTVPCISRAVVVRSPPAQPLFYIGAGLTVQRCLFAQEPDSPPDSLWPRLPKPNKDLPTLQPATCQSCTPSIKHSYFFFSC